MPSDCKGICLKIKVDSEHNNKSNDSSGKFTSRTDGSKWCQICSYSIVTNDISCECCGQRFRLKPRNYGKRKSQKIKMLLKQ